MLVGGIPQLGSWDPNAQGLRLIWSQGHIWRIKMPRSSLPDSFEFKFVIRDTENDKGVVIWEGNPNHQFDLIKYLV